VDPAIRLLRDLVSIDSVSPTLVPGGAGEAAIADRIATALRATVMSFWTDAAILAQAGTPAVLFGTRRAGLHGREKFVEIESVLACRDEFADPARDSC
jgi:acetylornithine deacetylase/succinyl-diaminopimelate desuccinylase-like protein